MIGGCSLVDEVNHVKNGCLICVILSCWIISCLHNGYECNKNVLTGGKITKDFIFADT